MRRALALGLLILTGGLTMAVASGCSKCLALMAPKITDKAVYTTALQNSAVFGDLVAIRLMIDHGADVNAYDPLGRTQIGRAHV